MKICSYISPEGRESFGIVTGDISNPQGIIDLGDRYDCLRSLLSDEEGMAFARTRASSEPDMAFDAVRLLPVIPNPEKILCVGINFASHVKETGREIPTKPMIFVRFASSQVGANDDMIRPKVSDTFDYEGELAVIIGKRSRYVEPERTMERVAGFSCYNDGSIREWQRHSPLFTPGKNFPKTGAFGPWMVTADEIPDISKQSLVTRLNGNEVQRATLDDMIFNVEYLVSYCSTFTCLEPGDVIICGTTGGVGAFHKPPLWMKPDDTVEVEISSIGILRNHIAEELDSIAI